MADRTYTFILKNETSKSSSPIAGDSGNNQQSNGSSARMDDLRDITAKGIVAWKKVKPYIFSEWTHQNNMVRIETGANEYTQKLQFRKQVTESAVGFVESIAIGFAVGNVPGAIIAGGVSIFGKIWDFSYKYEEMQAERLLEQQTTNRNIIRAGTGGSRRGYERV